ncbi:hypothetical protein ADK91_14900, partial [Streptomyces sp. XY511]
GRECVEFFVGMFAFAVVEHHTGRVVLGRDRLGIKPLYVTEDCDRLRFASSLPALLAGGGVDTSLDPVALHQYLSWHGRNTYTSSNPPDECKNHPASVAAERDLRCSQGG